MTEGSASIAAAVTDAAKLMHEPAALDETLDVIVQATVETVPGFDHVGISIPHRNGEIETKAGTDQLVWELDDIQLLHAGRDRAISRSRAIPSWLSRTRGTTNAGPTTCR